MPQFGATVDNLNLAIEKSKSKKNGVYSFRGFLYRVNNNRLTHYADREGIFQLSYGFASRIWTYANDRVFYGWESNARKILKSI